MYFFPARSTEYFVAIKIAESYKKKLLKCGKIGLGNDVLHNVGENRSMIIIFFFTTPPYELSSIYKEFKSLNSLSAKRARISEDNQSGKKPSKNPEKNPARFFRYIFTIQNLRIKEISLTGVFELSRT